MSAGIDASWSVPLIALAIAGVAGIWVYLSDRASQDYRAGAVQGAGGELQALVMTAGVEPPSPVVFPGAPIGPVFLCWLVGHRRSFPVTRHRRACQRRISGRVG